MKIPPRNLTEAIESLTRANDNLERHLEESEKRKTVPPASPWAKSVEELYKPQPVRRRT